jgi:hypothetical protein
MSVRYQVVGYQLLVGVPRWRMVSVIPSHILLTVDGYGPPKAKEVWAEDVLWHTASPDEEIAYIMRKAAGLVSEGERE